MKREDRFHNLAEDDQRSRFERDHDRILYSSAFRRLAGITQVVRAGEADVFHNRLTHSMKVAQIGRRLAERIISEQPAESKKWGVNVDVVAAACLAHDLGHPPFGHIGETTLNELLEDTSSNLDGFEGNAQSFRVVTKLAVRFDNQDGLDLTRATLAAIIKYPWVRDRRENKKTKKWGVYRTELDEFEFARKLTRGEAKTAEAEIMDWADDIAYSVHDLEDFHRCQAIPWHLFQHETERKRLKKSAIDNWFEAPPNATTRLRRAYFRLSQLLLLVPELTQQPYEGTRQQRQQIRFLTSSLIGRYIHGIKLKKAKSVDGRCVEINSDFEDEVRLLKQVTRDYVVGNPALLAQQHGHMIVIKDLFTDLLNDINKYPKEQPKIFPKRLRHFLDIEPKKERIVADCISSLTEAEILGLHGRLRGYASGSVLDPIVR